MALALPAVSAAPALLAEVVSDNPDAIEEVLVVGSNRAYRGDFTLMETPAADLIISEQTLRDSGALNLDQALDLSSSVARQNNFGGLWHSFALRGFVGDENLPSNYLVNGFNAGRGFAGPRDMAAVAAVEVLKGPRAALYGRGEPGGTINLVTKRPVDETAGELVLSAARFDTWRASVDWNQTLGDDLAYRLVGVYEDAGSFRDTLERENQGFFPSVSIQLRPETRLIYELEYSQQKMPFDRGVLAVDGELDAIPRSRFLGEPGDGPMEGRALGHQLEMQHELASDWTLLVGANYRDTSLTGFSTEAELSGSRQALLVDGRTLTRQRRFRDYDANYRMLRAEISGDFVWAGLRHRLIVGADTDRFENDQLFRRARAPGLSSNPTPEQLQAIDIFAPVYGDYPLPVPGPLTDRVEVQRADGLYIQDQISLSEHWELRIGGRFDRFRQSLDNRATNSRNSQSDERFSPQAGLVYSPSDGLSLYAVYGEGFRALSGSDFSGSSFDPNISTAFEAGVKLLMNDGRMMGNLSVFAIDQENILSADPLNPGFQVAAGEAESRGIELDLGGELLPGLQAWFSYSYTDAEVLNDLLDPNFGLLVRGGDRLLNIPRHALSAQLVKETYVGKQPVRFGGGITHVGKRLGEVATRFELPDYTLARIFADYRVNAALSLRVEIDNLFDETYYSNSFSSLWVQPGMPRNYRFSADIRF